MAKYLYGVSVEGIQSFIFQTNKLREIVGASELVDEICTAFFEEKLKDWGIDFKKESSLLAAAGNIRYIFDAREDCEKVVRLFPKAVMEKADGISINQAVVESGGYPDDIQELEKRLRTQRNKRITIRDVAGLMVTETARKTGGVGYQYDSEGVLDLGQSQKLNASNRANRRLAESFLGDVNLSNPFPLNIADIVEGEENQSWIAVIHADGNSLGKKLIKMGELLAGDAAKSAFKDFSGKLDKATKKATKLAFDEVVEKVVNGESDEKKPFRPVVLGGDDLTAIIRGDLALEFAQKFLEKFEQVTKEVFTSFDRTHNIEGALFSSGLTACAGIAYIKANYPFHYGVKLAESLCQEAKKASRKIKSDHSPSSLMFHKVHASFIENFEDIVDKELSAENNVFFNYGPYFIHSQKGFDTVDKLLDRIKYLNEPDAPKSGLRNWLTELRNSPDMASQTLERIKSLNSRYEESLHLSSPFTKREVVRKGNEIEGKFTPIFDAMVLSNIQKQS